MPLAARYATESHASIDDLLGDGRYRFFSQGYKSTNPQLHQLRLAHSVSESTLTATAGLAMKGVWSVKGQSRQTPHLGTTDVLVLSCKMAEALLASRYSPEILPTGYLKSVTISGGSEPVEGALDQLECRATLQGTPNGPVSFLQCSVASMSATLEVAHMPVEPGLASVHSPSEEALVGGAATRLYGDLWAERQVSLKDVQLEAEDGRAQALLSLRPQPSLNKPSALRGLEAAYPHALSAIEYFVATLQLGQVLLYRLDDMDRGDSNTLWMRKTRIALSRPYLQEADGPGTSLVVQLRKSRMIAKDDESWRCADVVGTFDGGEVVCSVAHRLPTHLSARPAGAGQ